MLFSNTSHMHRHELVVLERVKKGVDRFTGPVFDTVFVAAVIYLICCARIEIFSTLEGVNLFNILFVLSALVFVLGVPVLVVAALIEHYLRRRIAEASGTT